MSLVPQEKVRVEAETGIALCSMMFKSGEFNEIYSLQREGRQNSG